MKGFSRLWKNTEVGKATLLVGIVTTVIPLIGGDMSELLDPAEIARSVMKQNAMTIRLDMQRKGWSSEDRISDMGWGCHADGTHRFGYDIWFTRWNWHGKRTDKQCFHAHSQVDMIEDAVRQAAKLAQRAWDGYPDQLVSQDANGELQLQPESIQAMFRDRPENLVATSEERYEQVFHFELELFWPGGEWPRTQIEVGLERIGCFDAKLESDESGVYPKVWLLFDRAGYHEFTYAVRSAIRDIVAAGFRVKCGRGFHIPKLGMNYDY